MWWGGIILFMVSVFRRFTGCSFGELWFDWFFHPEKPIDVDLFVRALNHPYPSVRQRGLDHFDWSQLNNVFSSNSLSRDGLSALLGSFLFWEQESVNWVDVVRLLELHRGFDSKVFNAPLAKAMELVGQSAYPESFPAEFVISVHNLVQENKGDLIYVAGDELVYPRSLQALVRQVVLTNQGVLVRFYSRLFGYSSLSDDEKLQVWLDCREGLLGTLTVGGQVTTVRFVRSWVEATERYPWFVLADILRCGENIFEWVELISLLERLSSVDSVKWHNVLSVLLKDFGVEEDLSGLPVSWLVDLYKSLVVGELV